MKVLFRTIAISAAIAFPVFALPIYQGGTGSVVFGVAPYGGAPNNGPSTYIANNFTGLNDILSSPGGGFLTANPVVANNLYQSGPFALPGGLAAAGGGNGFGAFGSGASFITGPLVGYRLFDVNADGAGVATYSVSSWISTWTNAAAFNGSVGAWLTTGGTFGTIASAGAVSLRVHATSNTAGSPFLGGFNFPELVLAPRAIGNCFGINGVVQCGATSFRGIAMTQQNMLIPAGDVITISATLTALIDPDFTIGLIDPTPDLLALLGPGTTLPDAPFAGMDPDQALPEPATLAVAVAGLIAIALRYRKS